MFAIVVFSDENSCEGVPSSWIKNNGNQTFCLWPQTTIGKISTLIKKKSIPDCTWPLIKCIVKDYANSYDDMVLKRRAAERVTTEIASDSSEDGNVQNNPLPEITHPGPASCSGNVELLPSHPKKIKTIQSCSSMPSLQAKQGVIAHRRNRTLAVLSDSDEDEFPLYLQRGNFISG